MIIDFFLSKVLLRSFIASIFPVMGYSLCWAVLRIALFADLAYFNATWYILAFFILVPPFSQLPLWMFFTSIKTLIDMGAKSTTKPLDFVPFFRKGNFLPVKSETQYQVDEISQGSIPKDISGTYLKNGPNSVIDDPTDHLFDGDGMIHAFNFKDGQLYYCNRWTKTNKYKHDVTTGVRRMVSLGSARGFACLMFPLCALMVEVGYVSMGSPKLTWSTANTALILHGKRLYALLETDVPFELQVERTEKEVDIKQKGYDNFDGQLTQPCAAHPKVDKETGEFFIFCYAIGKPLVQCTVMNKDR